MFNSNDFKEYIKNKTSVTNIIDKGFILKNTVLAVINAKTHKGDLQSIPHKLFEDLAMVYQLVISNNNGPIATRLISHDLLIMHGVSLEELYTSAKANTIAEGVLTESLADIMRASLTSQGFPLAQIDDFVNDTEKFPLFTMTNERNCFGASLMLIKYVLKKAAKVVDGNFYIVPLNIHKLMVTSEKNDLEYLKQILCDNNQNEVETEDVLSYNIYHYDIISNQIKIA